MSKHISILSLFFLLMPIFASAQLGFNRKVDTQTETVDYNNPKEYTIAGITVEGAKFLDHNALIGISGLKIGDKIKIPSDGIANAIKKLWKQGLLGDVKIVIDKIEGDNIFLKYVLAERPRLSRFVFEGVNKSQRNTLREKINSLTGRIVNDVMLKNMKSTVVDYYTDKGFKNVDVQLTQQQDSIFKNNVYLLIKINKKKKVHIQEIEFEGVEQLAEKKLRKKLKKTKQKSKFNFLVSSKFLRDEFKNDKNTLINYYNKKGYRDARIVTDSVYDIDEENVGIKLKIHEGNKYFYRNITWYGNYVRDDATLSSVLGIKKGDVYNPEELQKRLSFNPNGLDVSSLYLDNGYLFFNVDPIEVKIENDSIDIEMRIFEGEQADIRNIILNGNTRTHDHVVRREIRTLPGQKFSRSDLIRSQRELSQLGYFDPESMDLNPQPNPADGTVDIKYGVTEKPSDQIELSGGWGGNFGFVGTLGLSFNNFSIKKAGKLREWRPVPQGDGQKLSLRLQANGRQFQTYSLSFTEPWFGGRKPNSLSVSLSRSIQRIIPFNGGAATGSLKVSAATLSSARRLKVPDDWFSMSQSFGFTQYSLDNYNAGFRGITNGNFNSFVFNTTISRNSVDSPIYPRSGSNLTLSMAFTPPYSLFDKSSLAEGISADQQFKWVEYHKWMFDNSWFLSLAGKLVLNARVHFGYLGSYNSKKGAPPFERFILGGSGLSFNNFLLGTDIVGLRGYDDNSITPTESSNEGGTVYEKFTMELRYPVTLGQAASIYVLGFAEAGNNWISGQDFNPFELKRSIGVGARIFMPAFGLLGLDWGYGFDQIPGNNTAGGAQFHFTIGQTIR